jgi:hypothetical protein
MLDLTCSLITSSLFGLATAHPGGLAMTLLALVYAGVRGIRGVAMAANGED